MIIDTQLMMSVVNLAHQAGNLILSVYQQPLDIEYKTDESPLTLADQLAHHAICDKLCQLTPQWPILSEESVGIDYSVRKEWHTFWLVDPLDGTKEFISQNGEFTVNIALIHQGKPVWGVVYAPVLNKTWLGGLNFGSQVMEHDKIKSIHVKSHQAGGIWKIVGSRSHQTQATLDFLKNYQPSEFISMGSSLKFCLVAEGHAHLYPRFALTSEWDTGAAHAILQGAGGDIYHADTNQPLIYNKEELLNPFFIAK